MLLSLSLGIVAMHTLGQGNLLYDVVTVLVVYVYRCLLAFPSFLSIHGLGKTHTSPWGKRITLQLGEGRHLIIRCLIKLRDNFSIYLLDGLAKGSSNPCETFRSPRLSKTAEFDIHVVELWVLVR